MTPVIERGDLVIDVQAFGQRNAARGHGNGQRRRSAIPEWFALLQLLKGRRRRGRRIEKIEELPIALGILAEGTLNEDGGLGFTPRDRAPDFRALLSAQGC